VQWLLLSSSGDIVAARKLQIDDFNIRVEKQGREYIVIVDGKPVLKSEKLPEEIKLYGYPVALTYREEKDFLPYFLSVAVVFITALFYFFTSPSGQKREVVKLYFPDRIEIGDEFFEKLKFPELDFEVYAGGERVTQAVLAMTEEDIIEQYIMSYPEERLTPSLVSALQHELIQRFRRLGNLYGEDMLSCYFRKIRDYLIAHGYTIHKGKTWKKDDNRWVEVKPCLVLREEHISGCLAVEGEVLIFTTPELEEKLRKYEGFEVVVLE